MTKLSSFFARKRDLNPAETQGAPWAKLRFELEDGETRSSESPWCPMHIQSHEDAFLVFTTLDDDDCRVDPSGSHMRTPGDVNPPGDVNDPTRGLDQSHHQYTRHGQR